MHSQREQSKFWVLMTHLKKSVVSMQNMWKGEVQSTKHLSSYIDMVQTLLLFVRATRESDWQLHLSTVRLMMPMLGIYLHTGWKWSICL